MWRAPPEVTRVEVPVSERQRNTSKVEDVPSPPVWPQNQKCSTPPETAKS